jgi:hypothetical protein
VVLVQHVTAVVAGHSMMQFLREGIPWCSWAAQAAGAVSNFGVDAMT